MAAYWGETTARLFATVTEFFCCGPNAEQFSTSSEEAMKGIGERPQAEYYPPLGRRLC